MTDRVVLTSHLTQKQVNSEMFFPVNHLAGTDETKLKPNMH